MKGSREHKVYITHHRRSLKAIHHDDLWLFRLEWDRKWRKVKRRARDGSHGTSAQFTGEPDV